jgi:hypothetical protein
MQHLDEGTIHAWLDGALSSEEAARVEAHLGSCSMCADATAEARGLIAASSRILTALDDVPSVRVSPGARWGRRSLTTWLVREKIAAVVSLVIAGGALALVMARNTPRSSEIDLASEPVRTFELAAADSPAPPPVAAEEPVNQESARLPATVTSPSPSMVTIREAPPAAAPPLEQQAPMMIADAAPLSTARTDDSLRSVTLDQVTRAEASDASAQASSALTGKIGAAAARRRAADAPANFAETRPTAPAVGTASGAAAPGETPRLVLEERMREGGREVRRRIYSVDSILVTLDERAPALELQLEQRRAAQSNALELEQRRPAQSANAPRQDSAAVSTTIRWTDASGKEFTLTGAAPQARLEQLRKLLGY